MSVFSILTSIADKIRSLLGISGKLGLDAMNTNLETANTEVSTQEDLMNQIIDALEGKSAGGATAKEEQEKSVDIIENGTTEVLPDDGKVLSKVTVNVDVQSGGDINALLDGTLSGEFTSNTLAIKGYAFFKSLLTKAILPNAIRVATNSFCQSELLEEVDAPLLETIEDSAFNGCVSLKDAIFPNITSISGSSVFYNCIKLKRANFPKLTTVTGSSMFYGCSLLEELSFPLLNNMGGSMFYSCTGLKSVNLPSVTNIANNYIFRGCTSLEEASIPLLTTIKGSGLFRDCSSLTMVDMPLLTQISGTETFRGCSTLKDINLPLVTTMGNSTFQLCDALEEVLLPSLLAINTYVFQYCSNLTKCDFPKVTSINGGAFTGCTKLDTLILRSETLCTLNNTNAFNNCTNFTTNGHIYVPQSLIASYTADSKWSTFANLFRALEDYTVDGTITGALDESKI